MSATVHYLNRQPQPPQSRIESLATPTLVVERPALDANMATMDAILPGSRLRPHVKAFKSTALAHELALRGHRSFCAATPREIEGLVHAGLTDDLLLVTESFDLERLGLLAHTRDANITVAVDSDPILDAAIGGGIERVLIDIDVGLGRGGCDLDTAQRLADRARAAGLDVRGVMGYEDLLMVATDERQRVEQSEVARTVLLDASSRVGGDVISGGGTGTFAINTWCTEIQAGAYCLMDTHCVSLGVPFQIALTVLTTVVSKNATGWIVVDAGMRAFGMGHGKPSWEHGEVAFCSDEYTTLAPHNVGEFKVGDRVRLQPAHIDPTVAFHREMWVASGNDVLDRWPIDLKHW